MVYNWHWSIDNLKSFFHRLVPGYGRILQQNVALKSAFSEIKTKVLRLKRGPFKDSPEELGKYYLHSAKPFVSFLGPKFWLFFQIFLGSGGDLG